MVVSIFSFSHNIFKWPLQRSRSKSQLCGKWLTCLSGKRRYNWISTPLNANLTISTRLIVLIEKYGVCHFLTVFWLYLGGQSIYPCFPGVLLTSNPHNILSKPLAAFPHNHYRNDGQELERNESCSNDHYQS